MGEFNARMAAITGDHVTNQRGTAFSALLDDSLFKFCQPTLGKFTTVTNGGRGITDLVLTSDAIIKNLVIHELESLGGSDHRPLIFQHGNFCLPEREFQRWNVRKFTVDGIKEKYLRVLNITRVRVLDDIETSETVEQAWELVVQWIENAALKSCGRFKQGKPGISVARASRTTSRTSLTHWV